MKCSKLVYILDRELARQRQTLVWVKDSESLRINLRVVSTVKHPGVLSLLPSPAHSPLGDLPHLPRT